MRRRSNISFFIGFPLPACAAAFSSEGTDTREDGKFEKILDSFSSEGTDTREDGKSETILDSFSLTN